MKFPFVRGARVRALKVITEGGDDSSPDRTATRLHDNPNYVHAEPGELGTVVETNYPQEIIDQDTGEVMSLDTVPTVAFDRTGTATIVCDDEIELVEPLALLGCDRCGAFENGKCWYHVEAAGPEYRCLEWWGHADCGKGLS